VTASASNDGAATKDGATSGGERVPTIAAGTFRITPFEITQKQYKEFLDDVAAKTVPQPPECSWNTSFAPASGSDCVLDANATPNRPMRCVDWCDARAFCEWAGLRLCGKIGGGANPFASYEDPGSSQWHAACGGTANTPYPYGGSFNQAACHFNAPSGPAVDVGAKTACEGGYKGLFDMLGNIGEWEDSCNGSTGAGDDCRIRGGYYAETADSVECGTNDFYTRDDTSPKFGIRCCSK
jgi:formylglycine-generating enzyme